MPCRAVPRHVIPCHAMQRWLCHAIPCRAMLAIPWCSGRAMPYHAVPRWPYHGVLAVPCHVTYPALALPCALKHAAPRQPSSPPADLEQLYLGLPCGAEELPRLTEGSAELVWKWRRSLRELDLAGRSFGQQDLARAMAAFGPGSPLRSLNLAGTKVTPGALRSGWGRRPGRVRRGDAGAG